MASSCSVNWMCAPCDIVYFDWSCDANEEEANGLVDTIGFTSRREQESEAGGVRDRCRDQARKLVRSMPFEPSLRASPRPTQYLFRLSGDAAVVCVFLLRRRRKEGYMGV